MNIFWFRRDLRLEDNVGLFHALNSDEAVLPIFIFDETILSQLPKDDARVAFIHQRLEKIQNQLQAIGKSLAVFHGTPFEVFTKLIDENKVITVHTNHDYEPYARKRDLELNLLFKEKNIEFKTSKDQVIFEKSDVVKDDGTPYVVYTPFSNKWKDNFRKTKLIHYKSEDLLNKITLHSYSFLSLSDIGFESSKIKVTPYDISNALIYNYEATRNFPAMNKTSYLGIYLRFGAVSIRKMVAKTIESKNETFLKELIWREFFMQILWHFPHTINSSFRPKYDEIKWENNELLFQKWCEGKTGYPFVDAGMRELFKSGYLSNRMRQIVASYWVYDLQGDWRVGASWFESQLIDYDVYSNQGNWLYLTGRGTDPRGGRRFNVAKQTHDHDPQGKYQSLWL
jgi:deoxyribodipyrimidine photo-lyase